MGPLVIFAVVYLTERRDGKAESGAPRAG